MKPVEQNIGQVEAFFSAERRALFSRNAFRPPNVISPTRILARHALEEDNWRRNSASSSASTLSAAAVEEPKEEDAVLPPAALVS